MAKSVATFSSPGCQYNRQNRQFMQGSFQAIMLQHVALPDVLYTAKARAIGEEDQDAIRENSSTPTGRRKPMFERPFQWHSGDWWTHLFSSNWKMFTQNKFVRSLVSGIKTKFIETPVQTRTLPPLRFTNMEAACVDQEVESILRKRAIHRVAKYDGQFVSNIFLPPKKSGRLRPIINLKRLNSFIKHNISKWKIYYLFSLLLRKERTLHHLIWKTHISLYQFLNNFENTYDCNGKGGILVEVPCMNLSAYALGLVPHRITSQSNKSSFLKVTKWGK